MIARLRVNSRAGWVETIHAPLPSAAACWLYRAVAMIAPLTSRAMKSSEIWIAILGPPWGGEVRKPVPNQEPTTPVSAGRRRTASDAIPHLPAETGLHGTPSDETAVHGMQKVRGSNPLSSTRLFSQVKRPKT